MIYPRKAGARSSKITASITKSGFRAGGFLAGAFLWLGPAPGAAVDPVLPSGTSGGHVVLAEQSIDKPGEQPAPAVKLLEDHALEQALKDLGDKAKSGEFVLIYLAGHGAMQPGVEEGTNGLPAR